MGNPIVLLGVEWRGGHISQAIAPLNGTLKISYLRFRKTGYKNKNHLIAIEYK
jgi:hypothetical protein